MSNSIIPHEPWQVAVYDVELKECVLIFSSMIKCGQYLLTHVAHKGSVYQGGYIRTYVMNKGRCHKNIFNRPLAFRKANKEQIEQLGEELFVVLNPDFSIEKLRKHTQDFILEGEVVEPCAFKGISETSGNTIVSDNRLYKKSKREKKERVKPLRIRRNILTWKLLLDKTDIIIHGRQESEYTICGKVIKKEYSKPLGKMKDKEELTCENCRKSLNS